MSKRIMREAEEDWICDWCKKTLNEPDSVNVNCYMWLEEVDCLNFCSTSHLTKWLLAHGFDWETEDYQVRINLNGSQLQELIEALNCPLQAEGKHE